MAQEVYDPVLKSPYSAGVIKLMRDAVTSGGYITDAMETGGHRQSILQVARDTIGRFCLNQLPAQVRDTVRLSRFAGVQWVMVPLLSYKGWRLSADIWRTAMRIRLGIVVLAVRRIGPECREEILMDTWGYHALACAGAGSLIVRHNRVRDLLVSLARALGLKYSIEWLMDDASQKRPDDVVFWNLLPDRAVVCDVAVISAFSHDEVIMREGLGHAATACEATKHRKYSNLDSTKYTLHCCVTESTGAKGLTMRKLNDLLRKYDREHNMRFSSPENTSTSVDSVAQSIVMSIARSTSEAVLQRGPPRWRPKGDGMISARASVDAARRDALSQLDVQVA